jgi:hypothetical protein
MDASLTTSLCRKNANVAQSKAMTLRKLRLKTGYFASDHVTIVLVDYPVEST